jgi:hypothetical protein
MADAADSKSVARKGVWVRLPPPAPLMWPEMAIATVRDTPARSRLNQKQAETAGDAVRGSHLSRATAQRRSCQSPGQERARNVQSQPALEQIEMELVKEEAHLPLPPPFPHKPYKTSTVILFSVFGFLVAFAAWVCFKELVIPFFPLRNRTL